MVTMKSMSVLLLFLLSLQTVTAAYVNGTIYSSNFFADANQSITSAEFLSNSITLPIFSAVGGIRYTLSNTTGTYVVHNFTTNSSFNLTAGNNSVEILVIGGGGGGGYDRAGGGGAGGLRYNGTYNISGAQNITVTIGNGGTGGSATTKAGNGSNSVFGTITAAGGGAGGDAAIGITPGMLGGSGGGGYGQVPGTDGGIATPAGQGNNGGAGAGVQNFSSGGGGGAGSAGSAGSQNFGGNGGNGAQYNISGTLTYYAGGGGGARNLGTGGAGGLGGGGGAGNTSQAGIAGIANTGGGGGGGGNGAPQNGGSGGTGMIIVRYPQIADGYNWTRNTYLSKNFTATFTIKSFLPLFTYQQGSGINNVSVDISCDGGTTYRRNVTSGNAISCQSAGTALIYNVTLYGNDTWTPEIRQLNITINANSAANNISSLTALPANPVISTGIVTIDMNCSIDGLSTVNQTVVTVEPPSTTGTNFTMTTAGGNIYEYNYSVGGTAGTYQVIGFCIDDTNQTLIANTSFTAVTSGGGGGGSSGGGGGGGSTNIIVPTRNLSFETDVVDKLLYIKKFTDEPTTFSFPIEVTRTITSCQVDAPLNCSIINSGTTVLIQYTEPQRDFFTKTLDAKLTGIAANSEIATSQLHLRIVNLAYSVGGFGQWRLPDFFTTFPYLLNRTNGYYAGIRIIAFIVALSAYIIFAFFRIKR